jgi:hypothetical protein
MLAAKWLADRGNAPWDLTMKSRKLRWRLIVLAAMVFALILSRESNTRSFLDASSFHDGSVFSGIP